MSKGKWHNRVERIALIEEQMRILYFSDNINDNAIMVYLRLEQCYKKLTNWRSNN